MQGTTGWGQCLPATCNPQQQLHPGHLQDLMPLACQQPRLQLTPAPLSLVLLLPLIQWHLPSLPLLT